MKKTIMLLAAPGSALAAQATQLTLTPSESLAGVPRHQTEDITNSVGSGSGAVVSFSPAATTTLEAGTYTFSLKIANNDTDGYFTGLGSASVNYTAAVPEPATATLSLLALAGLAARRRRK